MLTLINFFTVLIDDNISYISFDKLLICSYLHVIKTHLEFLDPGIRISLGPPKNDKLASIFIVPVSYTEHFPILVICNI